MTCQVYNHRDDMENTKRQIPINQYNIALNEELCYHDAKSLIKCCETLAFLVRDAAHITPHNFESCVHAIRTFVEANVNGGEDRSCYHHRYVLVKLRLGALWLGPNLWFGLSSNF